MQPWGHLTSHLPLELCEMIIDWIPAGGYISYTLRSLAVCALVCRAWNLAAQQHLDTNFGCKNAILSYNRDAMAKPFLLRYVIVLIW